MKCLFDVGSYDPEYVVFDFPERLIKRFESLTNSSCIAKGSFSAKARTKNVVKHLQVFIWKVETKEELEKHWKNSQKYKSMYANATGSVDLALVYDKETFVEMSLEDNKRHDKENKKIERLIKEINA